jgi:hypothetical protein
LEGVQTAGDGEHALLVAQAAEGDWNPDNASLF